MQASYRGRATRLQSREALVVRNDACPPTPLVRNDVYTDDISAALLLTISACILLCSVLYVRRVRRWRRMSGASARHG